MDNRSSVDVLYFDLAKAFESVVHSKLIAKLKCYGVTNNLLRWFNEFLTDRFQCVSIEGEKSAYLPVTSGVIQGSVVGPFLFTIFMNDLSAYLKQNAIGSSMNFPASYCPDHILKIYADDLKLYSVVDCGRDADFLQASVDCLHDWCNTWQLKINTSKCGVLHLGANNLNRTYYVNGQSLQNLSSVNDLGIQIDQGLTFKHHIDDVVNKARARCAVFLRNYISRDAGLMKTFFTSFVRPILETNSIIWSPETVEYIDKIERVQRFFLSKIDGFKFITYSKRLENVGLNSLRYRRVLFDLIFLFKILTGHAICNIDRHLNFKAPYITRGHTFKLDFPDAITNSARNKFNYRIVDYWNKLPCSALNCISIDSFHNCLQRYMPDNFTSNE
jgi:hypothetical protein